ncbi:type 4a pilus biogenesis protein PilO [Syntrophomonas curvata]
MSLSQRDQALLVFLIVILIGFGFYRLLYLPINKEIRTITAGNRQLQMEKENLQAKVRKVPAKLGPIEDKLADLNKRLPADDEMISLLTVLDETTAEHSLPFAAIDYKGAEKPDKTGVQVLVFNIGTKGRITQLLNFLNELEKAERLISVEDVSFNAVKAETQETEAIDERPPAYYIAPPDIPEAKLQRIKFEAAEEKESATEAERPVAESFMPDSFEMKITINAYYAGRDKAARAEDADTGNKPANDAQNIKGEV